MDQFEPRSAVVSESANEMSLIQDRLRKIFLLAKQAIPTVHTIRQPFDSYVSDSSGVVLVGEAAHPMMVGIGACNHGGRPILT